MNKSEQPEKVDWAEISDEEDEQSGEEKNETQTTVPQQGDYVKRGGNRGPNPYKNRGERRGPNHSKREPQPKENQPKNELINLIGRSKEDQPVVINLFDVEYNATEEDIRKLYNEVTIDSISSPKKGIFLLEMSKSEALKIVEIGSKVVNNRPFFMKLGYANKQMHTDEPYHNVNKEKYKQETGVHRDYQKGPKKQYNRKERVGEALSPGFKKPYQNKDRQPRDQPKSDAQPTIDPNDKFFKGHDPAASEFKIKFIRTTSNKADSKTEDTTKTSKPNPFGEAQPRNEPPTIEKNPSVEEKKNEEEPIPNIVEDHVGPETPTNTPVEIKESSQEDQSPGYKKQKNYGNRGSDNYKKYDNRYDNRGKRDQYDERRDDDFYDNRPPGIGSKGSGSFNKKGTGKSYVTYTPKDSYEQPKQQQIQPQSQGGQGQVQKETKKQENKEKKKDSGSKIHNPFALLND